MPNEPTWPTDLDALIAAPGYHSLLMENESVRVPEPVSNATASTDEVLIRVSYVETKTEGMHRCTNSLTA
jgi:hypothetical protein